MGEGQQGGEGQQTGGTVVPFPAPERPRAAEIGENAPDPETAGAAPRWEAARRRLMAEDAAVFASWFAPLRQGESAGECLTLIAPTAFDAAYIRAHYLDRLLRAARVSGAAAELRLVAAPQARP